MTDAATTDKPAKSLDDIRKKGEAAIDQAKTAAGDVLETGKARAEEELTHGKSTVARHVRDVAHAAGTAAKDLREHDQTMMASWAEAAADGMSDAANHLEGRDIGEIFGEVENYARRQPAVFLAGIALAGFAVARFAKAARENSERANAAAPAPAPYPTYTEPKNG